MDFPPTNAMLVPLPGGLTVILDEDHSAPVVSGQIWVETGSQHEGDFAGSGLSHLLEHMVFKGTRGIPGPELATRVNAAGGQWNAYTSFDRTVYYIDGPASSLDTFLEVLVELVFFPAFPTEDYETEKDVIRREIDMGRDDPDSAASQLLFRTVFQRDHRRHPVIGHPDLFNAVTHDDMTRYHRTRYLPSNSFFVLSGSFDSAAVLAKLEQRAAELPQTPLLAPVCPVEPNQLGRRVARTRFPVPVSNTTLAWQTPGLGHPDSTALELLAQIAGGGRSSRLYRRLHDDTGLAHHIGTWAWSPPDGPGLFSVSAEVDRERREQLEEAIISELDLIFDGNIRGELDKARRMILATQFRTLTTASGRAADLASNWHEARDLDFTRQYLARIEQVTPDDLKRVAGRYLRDDRLTITSLDPEESSAPAVRTSRNAAPGEITSHELSNGLRLVTRHDPRVPIVYLQAPFRAGLPSEAPATSGINQLHGTLLTKGTGTRSAAAIADTVESLGASLRAGSGNNTSIVSAFSLQPDLDPVLEVACDIMLDPTFPAEAFERERDTQLADIEESLEDPVKTAFRTLRQRLFGDIAYGLPRLGTAASLAALSPDLLKQHHAERFTAANGVVALFGDIETGAAVDLCEKHFGRLPAGHPADPVSLEASGTGEVLSHLDKQQAVLAVGFPGAPVDSGDSPALEILQDHCSNMAGPLFSRIREQLGLAYYVSATQFHGLGTGLFAFYLGTSPDQLELARQNLLAEIGKLATNGMSGEALAHSKTSVLATDALENQSNRAMAQVSAINTLFGLGPRHHEENAKRIQALTTAEVRETAARYFAGREPVIATVLPST
jgi:zinc protease